MEKFSCDSRVKCRTACNSDTSGAAAAQRAKAPAASHPQLPARPGAWDGARRPGRECSKITGSGIMAATATPQHAGQRRVPVSLDVPAVRISVAHTSSAWPSSGKSAAEIVAAENAARRQLLQHRRHRAVSVSTASWKNGRTAS